MAPQNGNGNGGRPSGRPSFNGMPGRRLGWQNPNNPHYVAPTPPLVRQPVDPGIAPRPMLPGGPEDNVYLHQNDTMGLMSGDPRLTAQGPAGVQGAPDLSRLAALARSMPGVTPGSFAPPGNHYGWMKGRGNPHRMGSFRPPAFGARARFAQGGQRPGGVVPMTTSGVPNPLAMGFGQFGRL